MTTVAPDDKTVTAETRALIKLAGGEVTVFERIEDPLKFMEEAGKAFAFAGVCGVKDPNQGKVLALACMCERKHPFQIARTYHLIEGKLSMRADAMLAELRRAGGDYKILSRTPEKAEIEITYKGQTARFAMTHEDAKLEDFYWDKSDKPKKNWATPRGRTQMLWARVSSDGVRAMAPEVNAGSYTPEELDSSYSATETVAVRQQQTPEELAVRKAELKRDIDDTQVVDVVAEPAPKTAPASAVGEKSWAQTKVDENVATGQVETPRTPAPGFETRTDGKKTPITPQDIEHQGNVDECCRIAKELWNFTPEHLDSELAKQFTQTRTADDPPEWPGLAGMPFEKVLEILGKLRARRETLRKVPAAVAGAAGK